MRAAALVAVVWLLLGGVVQHGARPARVAASGGGRVCATPVAADTVLTRDLWRATAGYGALQRAFYQADDGLYREQLPAGGNAYAYLWPYSRVVAAALALADAGAPGPGARDLPARLATLTAYWNADAAPPAFDSYVRPPFGAGGDRFYDDNVWIGLQLVEVYRRTGDADALAGARAIFDFMVSGWDDDPTHPAPGGVFWVAADWNRERGAVSTATGALLGLELFQLTHERALFDWAWRMYAWTNRYLLRPDGLYADHIDLDGGIDPDPTSYNQGAMLGASVLLYRVTGDLGYLAWAARIADAALARFGPGVAVGGGQVAYNTIFFGDLQLLERETGDARYRAALQDYADRLWEIAAAGPDGLLRAAPDAPAYLIDQAALVELYGILAGGPERCGAPPPLTLAARGF